MTGTGTEQAMSRFGRVSVVDRDDVPIMYLDLPFDVAAIQAGWPEFESRFTTLRGRTMLALVFPERGVYRVATVMRDEDDPDELRLRMGVLAGGRYLSLRLSGPARAVHRDIGPAFDDLRGLGEVDPGLPCVEVYRSAEEVECLLPVLG